MILAKSWIPIPMVLAMTAPFALTASAHSAFYSFGFIISQRFRINKNHNQSDHSLSEVIE